MTAAYNCQYFDTVSINSQRLSVIENSGDMALP